MATIQSEMIDARNRLVRNERWTLAQNDDGQPHRFASYSDRSVHVSGVFGGASVVFEGSNDGGATWVTLSDPQGAALTFTAVGLKQVDQISLLARPRVTGGDGTTNLQVNLCAKESS
jgi:hypothetical protein